MLKIYLKKNTLLKKTNDELTGKWLLKKKIHLFLKQLLNTKKYQILKRFYGVNLINLYQYWKYFKPYFFYKHTFPDILWTKLLHNYTAFIRYRTKKVFKDNRKDIKILLRKKKKIWYFPLDLKLYKQKRLTKYTRLYRFFIIWDCKDFKIGLDFRYYMNKIFFYFDKINLFYLITLKNSNLFIKNSPHKWKIVPQKNFLFSLSNRILVKKNLWNIHSKSLRSKYIYFLKIASWQNNTYLILRDWLTPKKHWAWLDFITPYKKPPKKIKAINRRIYLLKSIHLFWGFFNLIGKSPINILLIRRKILKFKNFCNVYRMTFFNILMLRMGSILLNTNLVSNIYYAKHLMKKGCFLLNKLRVYSINIVCKKWDIITISIHYKYVIYKTLLDKFKFIVQPFTFMLKGGYWISKYNSNVYSWNKRIFHNTPRYLQIDYTLLMIIIISFKISTEYVKSTFSLYNNRYNVNSKQFSWFKV
jgi:hypothetical protein